MSKIKVGIIGYGLSGAVFHAPFFSAMDEFELIKIQSRKKEELNKKYPHVKVVSSIEDLIEGVDLVVITTPNELHYPEAKQALQAGKHVLIEKPAVTNQKEADDLLKYKDKITVFHNRRYDGDFLTIKDYIDSGKLGDVVYFESRFDRFRPEVGDNWREGQDQVAGGILYDLGSHLMDQAYVLFGEPSSSHIKKNFVRENAKQDDIFIANFSYKKTECLLTASACAAEHSRRFLVHGTKGSLEIFGLDCQEGQLKAGLSIKDQKFSQDDREAYFVSDSKERIELRPGEYQSFFRNLAQFIKTGQKNPASLEEALFHLNLIWNL
jgi:scyllo-inositol 2-dehydrogenase (NADP+)